MGARFDRYDVASVLLRYWWAVAAVSLMAAAWLLFSIRA
jgi:hypothetical protein